MQTVISDDLVLQLEIQRFLAREVFLLDNRLFEEWLGLFAEEVRYWMPVLHTTEDPADATVGADGLAWFDEDRATLGMRVRRLSSPQAHAEHPASRTRRFVFATSIDRLDDIEVSVTANFAIYRNRRERDVDIFVGSRTDLLRRSGESFVIVARTLRLDQDIVANRDMSVLF